MSNYVDYGWSFSEPAHTDAYLMEPIAALLPTLPVDRPGRSLDLGCGNGWLSGWLAALWDGGPIKFWSRASLAQLLTEAGFERLSFRGAGRLPGLWKSMVLVGTKANLIQVP